MTAFGAAWRSWAYPSIVMPDTFVMLASTPYAMVAILGTAVAAVWTRNAAEVAERKKLYRDTRIELCLYLGIPSGPYMSILIPAAFTV
jgi:hypothetical protein